MVGLHPTLQGGGSQRSGPSNPRLLAAETAGSAPLSEIKAGVDAIIAQCDHASRLLLVTIDQASDLGL